MKLPSQDLAFWVFESSLGDSPGALAGESEEPAPGDSGLGAGRGGYASFSFLYEKERCIGKLPLQCCSSTSASARGTKRSAHHGTSELQHSSLIPHNSICSQLHRRSQFYAPVLKTRSRPRYRSLALLVPPPATKKALVDGVYKRIKVTALDHGTDTAEAEQAVAKVVAAEPIAVVDAPTYAMDLLRDAEQAIVLRDEIIAEKEREFAEIAALRDKIIAEKDRMKNELKIYHYSSSINRVSETLAVISNRHVLELCVYRISDRAWESGTVIERFKAAVLPKLAIPCGENECMLTKRAKGYLNKLEGEETARRLTPNWAANLLDIRETILKEPRFTGVI